VSSNDNGMDTRVREWQWFFSGLRKEFDLDRLGHSPFARDSLEFTRWVHPLDTLNIPRIERQIQARADSYLQHFTACMRNPNSAQRAVSVILIARSIIRGRRCFAPVGIRYRTQVHQICLLTRDIRPGVIL